MWHILLDKWRNSSSCYIHACYFTRDVIIIMLHILRYARYFCYVCYECYLPRNISPIMLTMLLNTSYVTLICVTCKEILACFYYFRWKPCHKLWHSNLNRYEKGNILTSWFQIREFIVFPFAIHDFNFMNSWVHRSASASEINLSIFPFQEFTIFTSGIHCYSFRNS